MKKSRDWYLTEIIALIDCMSEETVEKVSQELAALKNKTDAPLTNEKAP